MLKVKALIKLYKNDGGRKTAFISGYRPLFNFIGEMKKSGQISLMDKKQFFPGESDFVNITFLNDDYLGDNLGVGTKFTFGEGGHPLGESEISYIYK